MSLPLIALLFLAFLCVGYWKYGGFVARHLRLNDSSKTPAHLKNDGVDFVPTKPFYLFGQHFSAIAAAGPIAGPIVACQLFGWGPCLVWIALGVVFIGAVHDFTTLTASMRHGACSIAEIARETMGEPAGRAMMAFIWIALVYIIVAFGDITASSFVSAIEEIQGIAVNFNPGGAVASASVFYLLLSITMGMVQRFFNPPVWLLALIFVPAAFATSWLGTLTSDWFLLSQKTWALWIVLYCGIGSLLPVWLLLQPRGFLGGFILYFALACGLVGIFFGGYEVKQPLFTQFDIGGATGTLFPFLFVTIACGACSGFHGLVCSGTTSKQVDKETHTRPVGYGAMLAEAFVAFIALAIVMVMSKEELTSLKPGTIYGNGIGRFLTLIIGPEHLPFAITFGAMAFSTFVFDTLDVSARLGRYLIQELTGLKNSLGAAIGTIATLGVPAVILVFAPEGSWLKFWTLFGSSNQLLAALTFLTLTLWLKNTGRPTAFTFWPMLFIFAVTLSSLVLLAKNYFSTTQGFDTQLINGITSSLLTVLALLILYWGWPLLRRSRHT